MLEETMEMSPPVVSRVPRCSLRSSCAVCLEDLDLKRAVKHLICAHIFHEECITPWLRRKSTCPICRVEVISSGASGVEYVSDSSESEVEVLRWDNPNGGLSSPPSFPREFLNIPNFPEFPLRSPMGNWQGSDESSSDFSIDSHVTSDSTAGSLNSTYSSGGIPFHGDRWTDMRSELGHARVPVSNNGIINDHESDDSAGDSSDYGSDDEEHEQGADDIVRGDYCYGEDSFSASDSSNADEESNVSGMDCFSAEDVSYDTGDNAVDNSDDETDYSESESGDGDSGEVESIYSVSDDSGETGDSVGDGDFLSDCEAYDSTDNSGDEDYEDPNEDHSESFGNNSDDSYSDDDDDDDDD